MDAFLQGITTDRRSWSYQLIFRPGSDRPFAGRCRGCGWTSPDATTAGMVAGLHHECAS